MRLRGLSPRDRSRPVAALAMLAVVSLAAACSSSAGSGSDGSQGDGSESGEASATSTPFAFESNVRPNAQAVPVDTQLELTATEGTFSRVKVVGEGEESVPLPGRTSDDGSTWTASELLEPGSTYTVRTTGSGDDGETVRQRLVFNTADLTLDEQTYPNITPLDGETVGVGMPVIIQFDVPVTDKASIERHLRVEASGPVDGAVDGAWSWYSDTEAHFRPRRFWQPGTQVTVQADINGVDAGNGVYGQLDREISFEVGQSIVTKVYVNMHKMDVYVGGRLARAIPVSTGKPGFETRSGTKVVIEKFRVKHMDAATTGISRDDPEYYNITDVPYALRVTYSGEFVHGAPWSVGSQGSANVSHGCVGMSVENARWLYNQTHRGDVIQVFGTDREIEKGNGWTDWDVSFAEFAEGSALS
jgi:lipoprotein-anchoring transpeptidase ErfK/SrfK